MPFQYAFLYFKRKAWKEDVFVHPREQTALWIWMNFHNGCLHYNLSEEFRIDLFHYEFTPCHGRMVRIPALYSGLTEVFVIFLSAARQIPE